MRSHGAGAIRMMTADGAARPFAATVADTLSRAKPRARWTPTWAAIWEKVAFNAALNTLCAATNCTVDQLGNHHDGPRLALAIAAEVAAVARAKGIAVDGERIARNVEHAIHAHRGHRPSMLQDVLAGRRTEIDAISGKVVAAAREAGVAVPHAETLLALVRLIDARVN